MTVEPAEVGDEGRPEMTEECAPPAATPDQRYFLLMCLTALGVVFGDIGTSPLYALRECFHGPYAVALTEPNVMGVLSLVVWSLLFVITGKYLLYVMRADNDGEGGILALMAVALRPERDGPRQQWLIIAVGLFGAALLWGDGMITPAISVLSAVEGLEVAAPAMRPLVLPLTILILAGLFLIQRRGTASIGVLFGPITLVWFLVLAALGVVQIGRHPEVLWALLPSHAVVFFLQNGAHGLVVLGAVFLVVTGGEALYADMGHLGRRPIQATWLAVVLPSLILNYFGQGALILDDPSTVSSPFFHMAPRWALWPLIGLSGAATIIASQAVISGTFSLARQAIMLGYSPRLPIVHTSQREIGQIYVPSVNYTLMVAAIVLVLGFGSSSNLAGAYGIAVSLTMLITTMLAFVVARGRWGWSFAAAGALTGALLVVDLSFLGANLIKILEGGWVPLAVAAVVYTAFSTWKRGREILRERLEEKSPLWPDFLHRIAQENPAFVPGNAVFMTSNGAGAPPALVHNLAHNHVLHEHIYLLTVTIEPVARVRRERRVKARRLDDRFTRIHARYGFMEHPDIAALLSASDSAVGLDLNHTTFVLGRETLVATTRPGMALWRERLFAVMSRNAQWATTFFGIPPDRVLEIGHQVEL